jgi:hypothetical protein
VGDLQVTALQLPVISERKKMTLPIPEFEQQRLQSLLEDAAKIVSQKVSAFNDQQIAISSGRTTFFEKIAIGSGASIAAIISFVGAKAHSLEPRWLLRTALITLAIAMFSALLRNYLHPYYVLATRNLYILEAQRKRDRCKTQCIKHNPLAIDIDTGDRIDANEYIAKWQRYDEETQDLIQKTSRTMNRFEASWVWSERACLVSLMAAALWLISLAWWNF